MRALSQSDPRPPEARTGTGTWTLSQSARGERTTATFVTLPWQTAFRECGAALHPCPAVTGPRASLTTKSTPLFETDRWLPAAVRDRTVS
jgi:hypothetical protein